MYSIHCRLVLLVVLSSLACGGEVTRPRVDPGACASASAEETFDCARLNAEILYDNGWPVGVAFVALDRSSDTDRYRVVTRLPDSTGHTVVEVQRRRIESLDTATVALLVTTPPSAQPGSVGSFFCTVSAVRLHFSGLGAVPDTLRINWTLATLAIRSDQCAAPTPSMTVAPNQR